VFATTYYPDLGTAEKPIFELSQQMPDTEFHIITTKFRKGLSNFEKIKKDSVYRVGFGSNFDKYLLPFLGVIKARQLHKQYKYRFVWSVMASYGGFSALLLKLLDNKINFLITFDEKEILNKGFIKSKLFMPIYKIIFRNADKIYLSNVSLEKKLKIFSEKMNTTVIDSDSKSFVNQVRYTYINLINKQDKKLARPK
ncbi:hypothetical protein KKG48_02540, partial [Patescibacteria group bacterium]|nr:hypothetical protein [Patescibacteria group bacterium]